MGERWKSGVSGLLVLLGRLWIAGWMLLLFRVTCIPCKNDCSRGKNTACLHVHIHTQNTPDTVHLVMHRVWRTHFSPSPQQDCPWGGGGAVSGQFTQKRHMGQSS